MTQSSIAVSKKSKKYWDKFKNYKSESYESMINRILKIQEQEDEELLTPQDIKEIEESIKDIENGKFYTQEQIEKEFGIKK